MLSCVSRGLPLDIYIYIYISTRSIAKDSINLVHKLFNAGSIDEKTKDWALTDEKNVQCHRFYTLPKIHKSLTNTPGRPIISGTNGPTEKLSKLVDSWLQDSVKRVDSYIQDSTSMLNIIEEWNHTHGPFPENTRLVTIDVVGLYTNIPHDDMMAALQERLDSTPALSRPSTGAVMEVAGHVLTNNVFSFENQVYRQVHGTAMGTPMAPSVANLFMACLEENMLGNSPVPVERRFWKRFIDDIFLLWTGTAEELEQFLTYINTVHPTIKFTSNVSEESVSFLDISVSLRNGVLHTDLHTKSTDSHAYLRRDSCHPAHVKKNLPYSQFLRLRRLCSDEAQFQKRCDELERHLSARGYAGESVRAGRERASSKSRQETLSYRERRVNSRVPFILTHNPRNPPLGRWLHDLQRTLIAESPRMKHVLPEAPICGERNCRSLRDILMPSVLPPPADADPGCHRCQRRKCVICEKHLAEVSTFMSCRTGESFNIRGNYTCDTSNIVYLISCKKCRGAQYTGQSQNSLRERFYLHRSHIGRDVGTPLTHHFNLPGHSLDDVECVVIERMQNISLDWRLKREDFWATKLDTYVPHGLNVRPP